MKVKVIQTSIKVQSLVMSIIISYLKDISLQMSELTAIISPFFCFVFVLFCFVVIVVVCLHCRCCFFK